MSLEEQLARDLHAVADEAQLGPVPVGSLARLGSRERTRRRTVRVGVGSAVVVAITVAVGVSATVLTDRNDRSGAPANRPSVAESQAERDAPSDRADDPLVGMTTGPGTAVPWRQGRTLHLGADTIATRHRTILFAGGTTVVGSPSAAGSAWFLVSDQVLVPLVQSSGLVDVRISADGDTIVWAEERAGEFRLEAYNVDAGLSTGTLALPVEEVVGGGATGASLYGVDNEGRAYLQRLGETPVMWVPGQSTTVPLSGVPNRLSSEVWPGGVMFQGEGAGPPGVFGTVDDQGAFTAVGEVPTDQAGTWSPSGKAYVYAGDGETLLVVRPESGDVSSLSIPTGLRVSLVAWESEQSVLVAVRHPDDLGVEVAALLRCDTRAAGCEIVGGVGAGRFGFPQTR